MMKMKDKEAISKEAERIFDEAFGKLKFNPAKRLHRIKAKLFGTVWLIHAMRHDNEILKEMTKELHELNEDIEAGYYHLEVTLDDAGWTPLPCIICDGEGKVYQEPWGCRDLVFDIMLTPIYYFFPRYMTCPECNGTGRRQALTKKLEELLKTSVPLVSIR